MKRTFTAQKNLFLQFPGAFASGWYKVTPLASEQDLAKLQ
jgi:hypothetical protein